MGFFTIISVDIIQSSVVVLVLICVSTQTEIFERKIQQKYTEQKQGINHALADAQNCRCACRLTHENKLFHEIYEIFIMEKMCVCNVIGTLQRGSSECVRNMQKRGICVNFFAVNSQYKYRQY